MKFTQKERRVKMKVKLEMVSLEKKKVLEKLMQLYLHDISADFPIDFNSSCGLYDYDLDYYFNNENSRAYFITSENNINGFILVDLHDDKNIIQELFVLNNYKRNGIGKIAINEIFNMFKGTWEIKSLPCSKRAESFWINVVKNYTKNNFNIEYIGKFNRAVITFKNA